MHILPFISGVTTLQAESADISGFLSALTRQGILVYDVHIHQCLTAKFTVRRKDLTMVRRIAGRKGTSVTVISRSGLYWRIISLLQRPVLLAGLGFIVFLSLWTPGKILFIRVEGNNSIPSQKIIEAAGACDLHFGADREALRSERIKNGLLESVGELQWVGVNSTGCVATISVRERISESIGPQNGGVSSIVAERDGVILSCTGTTGNLLCKPGQAVKAGQVLISGYTDCGLSIRAEQARGDIYAQTTRSLHIVMPSESHVKGQCEEERKKYGLLLGKKRINFYKDSGILPPGCGRMYEEYYIILPGGFQLPVAIVRETWYTYSSTVVSASEEAVQEHLEQFSADYLASQMLGGQILQSRVSLDAREDVWILRGEYVCAEMIGRVHSEEIITADGKNHGKNRQRGPS